ncbi:Rv1733c family protein [Parasphingorhabdus pacifica]
MARGTTRTHVRWIVQALDPRANPLRRAVDRVTALATVALLLGIVLAVPASAVVGNRIFEDQARMAEAEAARRHQVVAVVRGPAEFSPAGSGRQHQAPSARVPVRWTGSDGSTHLGDIRASPGSEVGDPVPIWVNEEEDIVPPPRTDGQVMATAVVVAATIMLGTQLLCALAIAVVRWLADVRARRAWHREWEIVQPVWTRRSDR